MATQHHCVGMDTETAGLEPGSEIYVIALFCTRDSSVHTFVTNGEDDSHIIEATQFMDASKDCICTFNGTSFDFKMMAAATSDARTKKILAKLALTHIDIMLQFACDNGYFSSLASFTQPTLNKGKIGSGGSVEEQWASQKRQEVIDYCADDAKLTADLYLHGANYGRIMRVSKAGKQSTWVLPLQPVWKAAASCMQNITIATFMDNPPPIHAMADWTLPHI